MTPSDHSRKIQAYQDALYDLGDGHSTYDEKDLWQKRYIGFVKTSRLSRIFWITWVEDNAEKIDWCRDLVVKAVENQLGIDK